MLSKGVIETHRESGGRRFRFLSVFTGLRPQARVVGLVKVLSDDVSPFADTMNRLEATSRAVTTASLLLDQGLYNQAIRRIHEPDELIIENVEVQYVLARAYRAAGNYEEALNYLLRSIVTSPQNLKIRISLAGVLGDMGRYEDMVRAAEWALELSPKSPEALGLAGKGNLELERFEAAAANFRDVLTHNPHSNDAHYGLALSYYQAGEHGRGIRHLTTLLDAPSVHPHIFYTLALFYADQGLAGEAADLLSRATLRFGAHTVRAWLQHEQFLSFRAHPEFQNLQLRLDEDQSQDISMILRREPRDRGAVLVPVLELEHERFPLFRPQQR